MSGSLQVVLLLICWTCITKFGLKFELFLQVVSRWHLEQEKAMILERDFENYREVIIMLDQQRCHKYLPQPNITLSQVSCCI